MKDKSEIYDNIIDFFILLHELIFSYFGVFIKIKLRLFFYKKKNDIKLVQDFSKIEIVKLVNYSIT